MAIAIIFSGNAVGSVNGNASLAFGETAQFGWTANGKRVFGGSCRGLSFFAGNLCVTVNPVAVDSQVADPDVYLGGTVQQV